VKLTLLVAIATLLSAAPALADKTDQVVLRNGDHLTGEIKGMTLGKLDFKTDDAGRPSIEWLKVVRMTSHHYFEVEANTGHKYYGELLPAPAPGELLVGVEGEVIPMDQSFWSRVSAYLDLGFTIAKANTAITLSGDGDFAYRGERLGADLNFNGYFQTDSNSTLVSQYSVTLTGTYFFKRWRAELSAAANHNDELGLELRLSLGAVGAYPILRNGGNEIWLSAGLVGDRELYANVDPNVNLAAYAAAEWQAFRYDSPKLDSDLKVDVLPVLTDLGRVRGTVSFRIKYEVFKDFNLGVKVSYTYDTRPPDTTASHTDYLASLTIGWSYRR
jgi:hypothetical protein